MAVEGHTDDRGSSEYNLALGQRRAEAVVKSLTLLGAEQAQLEAVSFGKERPAVQGENEDGVGEEPPRRAGEPLSMRASRGLALVAAAFVAFVALAGPAPARAGLFDDDEARRAILDLRKQLEQSNEQARAARASR